MRAQLSFSAIARAAQRVRDPYRLGDKVLLARVASLLGVSVPVLAKRVLVLQHEEGVVLLTRIDLRQAFDSVKGALRRSRVDVGGVYYDAIDTGQFS